MVKRKYMQQWGCVYRLTNTLTGKVYIGKTVDFNSRMSDHKCASHNPDTPISQAIQKYGWDAFKVDIIIDDVPEEDLKNLEDSYIEVENTLIPNGYNVFKNGGRVTFDKRDKRWRAYGPLSKYIGLYFTEEKANEALKLFKETGECMESDMCNRKRGTGSISKVGKRWRAIIQINKKRYCKTFDTPQQCEEWLTQMSDS